MHHATDVQDQAVFALTDLGAYGLQKGLKWAPKHYVAHDGVAYYEPKPEEAKRMRTISEGAAVY